MGKSIDKLETVTRVGLDLAKSVFQVHGVDASGEVVVARAIKRAGVLKFFGSLPSCLVAMEACASAHHWITVTDYGDATAFPFLNRPAPPYRHSAPRCV